MTFVVIKNIHNRKYAYLCKTIREGKKVRQITLKYLGAIKSPNEPYQDKRRKKGFKHSEETKQKIKQIWNTPEKKEFARQNRARQILPNKDTSIELKIQNLLNLLHIEFLTHYYISKTNHKYRCDIFIPLIKTIIECDGCYWHGCPICKKGMTNKIKEQMERDKIRTQELQDKGYKVIRLWEHDIKKIGIEDLKNKIQSF